MASNWVMRLYALMQLRECSGNNCVRQSSNVSMAPRPSSAQDCPAVHRVQLQTCGDYVERL